MKIKIKRVYLSKTKKTLIIFNRIFSKTRPKIHFNHLKFRNKAKTLLRNPLFNRQTRMKTNISLVNRQRKCLLKIRHIKILILLNKEKNSDFRMALFTMESGLKTCVMGMAFSFSQIGQSTKATGLITTLRAGADSRIQTGTSTMETGRKGSLREGGNTSITREANTMETGSTTCRMGSDRNNGRTAAATRASTSKARKMDKAKIHGYF